MVWSDKDRDVYRELLPEYFPSEAVQIDELKEATPPPESQLPEEEGEESERVRDPTPAPAEEEKNDA